MSLGKFILAAVAAASLAACAPSKFKTYDGPQVTEIRVFKSARKMYLMHGDAAISVHDIGLGFAPQGQKLARGDGRTPEGWYTIDRRNPDSRYHLSLGIDYPRPEDVARAAALGADPGGDIFIHGRGKKMKGPLRRDWTWGCIAVSDEEIENIYAMVSEGTPVAIMP